MHASFLRVYRALVIDRPVVALGLVCVLVAFFAVESRHFRLSASSESIILENDRALNDYRDSQARYGSDDFLIVTYTPAAGLWAPASIARLEQLRDELARVESVRTVISLLDVPLVNSPTVSIADLTREGGVRTFLTPGIDRDLATRELLNSPLYRNNVVSQDGRTAALQVIFEDDTTATRLLNARDHLRAQAVAAGRAPETSAAWRDAAQALRDHRVTAAKADRRHIQTIRDLLEPHRAGAQIYLGGVRMIIADMIGFIEHDLTVFGLGVLAFLIAALSWFFRKPRWVALPISCCVMSVVVMIGYLGMRDWPVTVVSSNFVSLLLIITMSITIHLIVRYRILAETPGRTQQDLVMDTMREMAKPCLYTAATTMVAFGSLLVSDIRPVVDFGWMMTVGIAVAFALNFTYVPAVLSLLTPERVAGRPDATSAFTMAVAGVTLKRAGTVVVVCAAVAVLGAMGIARLDVENRFIDHFKRTTEIYRGMELIDAKLGGTMPLDIVLDIEDDVAAPTVDAAATVGAGDAADAGDEADTFADPFDDPFGDDDDGGAGASWFNGQGLARLEAIHDYLDALPAVGKVMSLATGMKVFRQLNDGRMPDDYELALLRKHLPDEVAAALLTPYLSADGTQTRVSMRLIESAPSLKRHAFIKQVRAYLTGVAGLDDARVRITGMAVLYTNLLQSLYQSQILTLGAVFAGIGLMFLALFRSVAFAVVALMPNVLAGASVLGVMGWWGIPLDVMTITIAAITVGIAVDHAIHYVHRFQVEFATRGTYRDTILACHGSIGRAIYYTAVTITVGFSILAFSSFIPTIYFGLLTGLAMILALASNLTLLAALILLVKPLGAEHGAAVR